MVELITLLVGMCLGSGIAYFCINYGIETQKQIARDVKDIVNPDLNLPEQYNSEDSNTTISEDTNLDWEGYPYTDEYIDEEKN